MDQQLEGIAPPLNIFLHQSFSSSRRIFFKINPATNEGPQLHLALSAFAHVVFGVVKLPGIAYLFLSKSIYKRLKLIYEEFTGRHFQTLKR